MTLKSKLKMAWEDKKLERAREKKLENEIYERKRYDLEMEKQAERHTKSRERAESRAEYRVKGGHLGAVKRGAQQTSKGLGKMAVGGFKYGVKTIKAQAKKKPRSRSSSNNYDPFGINAIFGGGSPKPRKTKRKKGKKQSSNNYGFGWGNIKL